MRTIFAQQLEDFFQEVDPSDKPSLDTLRANDSMTNSTFNFICFNYTNTIDKIYEALKRSDVGRWRTFSGVLRPYKMGKLIHAHGTLDSWPIIGVCDDTCIINKELLSSPEFKAVMTKRNSIEISGQLWRQDTMTTINNSHIICIFGMSLGQSDSDYWNALTKWLSTGSDRHIIVFWYDTKNSNITISIRDKFNEVTFVKNKLASYSSWTPEVYSRVQSRIHVVLKPKNMFYLPAELRITQS